MKISEVSKLTQLSIDTIRYYEKLGLISPKIVNRRRIYSESDIEMLGFIVVLKEATFTLEEIKYFVELDKKLTDITMVLNMPRADLEKLLKMIESKNKAIEDKIVQLSKAQQILDKLSYKLEGIK